MFGFGWPQWVLGLVVAAAIVALAARLLRRRPSAEEIEKRRRTELNAKGKLGDGEVVDIEGVAIVYSYSVGGVGYTASQDVSALEALMPENTMSLIGPALVKFDPRNPANSIVLCEEWCGVGQRAKIYNR
jgi:hypothetical protein